MKTCRSRPFRLSYLKILLFSLLLTATTVWITVDTFLPIFPCEKKTITVRIPNLSDETQRDRADRSLFDVKVQKVYNGEYPRGAIISQTPAPDSYLKLSQDELPYPITVVSSLGAKRLSLPDLVGSTKTEAMDTLQKLGLTVRLMEKYGYDAPPDVVIATVPAAGSSVTDGDCIELQISLAAPPSSAIVPSLVGKTEEEAVSLLQEAGLRLGAVRKSDEIAEAPLWNFFSFDFPPFHRRTLTKRNIVIAQSHIEGTYVLPDTAIDIEMRAVSEYL